MGSVSPKQGPQSHPQLVTGSVTGDAQTSFNLDVTKSISGHIDDVYKAMQIAVEAYGGTVALAASMEKSLPGISLRVRHERDSKGDVQEATLSMVGHIASDHEARLVFLHALCDAWGRKHTEANNEPTTEEKYRALVSRLAGSPAGEAILSDAARAGGFNAGAFRR